jgi:hypothetical protein
LCTVLASRKIGKVASSNLAAPTKEIKTASRDAVFLC